MRESYVRVEVEDRKTQRGQPSRIIHAYGHGGAGWSLAFGSAREVARLVEQVLSHGTRDVSHGQQLMARL